MRTFQLLSATGLLLVLAATVSAQGRPHVALGSSRRNVTREAVTAPFSGAAGVALPSGYLVGSEDVLAVVFWRDEEMTSEVTVRPDGMITLPLIGDIKAAGMRPEALGVEVGKAAEQYLTDPSVTVLVREINSRKVFITGQVATSGVFPLAGPLTVMQLIALAGGLTEYADTENVSVMRQEEGQTRAYRFNYKDVAKGRNLEQNIQLRPGDTVVIP